MVKDPVQTSAILWQRPPKPYKLLIFFTISVIFLKMGKHSDFRISSFQVEDAWRILQINRKTEKYFTEFMRIERWICKNRLRPKAFFFLFCFLFFHWRRIENDWRLKLTNSDNSDSKLLDFLDQNEKICKLHCKKGK